MHINSMDKTKGILMLYLWMAQNFLMVSLDENDPAKYYYI